MAEPADDPLGKELAEGQEAAFAALYDRFGASLFRTAAALLNSREDAEDAVQEVFVGLVRARHTLARVQNLRAYLFAALRHAVGRRLADRGRARAVPIDQAEDLSTSEPPQEGDRAARMEQAVRELPAEQRELVALKVDGGLTFAEIAGLLGISPNTAASRYRYALEKLRAALEEVPHER
ncbi:MAG: sigma-70 family RNA polymerase sigma factor [Gemmataceae bacterium]